MQVWCMRHDIICNKRGTPKECNDCHFSNVKLLTPDERKEILARKQKKVNK